MVYSGAKTASDVGKTQIESAVSEGRDSIAAAVAKGTSDIAGVRQAATMLKGEVTGLQSDINGYKEVNGEMEKLQKQFHGQTDNLSKLDLRVHSLETVGSPSDASEPAGVGLKQLGCQFSPASPWAKGSKIVLCAQGSPPLFYQRAGDEVRPVSSLSPVGFQDVSISARPACGAASRGTFYVEKGAGRVAEHPFLAARKSDGMFRVGSRWPLYRDRGEGCGICDLGRVRVQRVGEDLLLYRHGAVALLAGVGASGAAIGGGLLLASWVGCSGLGFLIFVGLKAWRRSGRVSWRQLQPSAIIFFLRCGWGRGVRSCRW